MVVFSSFVFMNSQEKYQDSRGWQILAPSGWNKFDGEVGAYDIKWQDLVDPTGRYHLLFVYYVSCARCCL